MHDGGPPGRGRGAARLDAARGPAGVGGGGLRVAPEAGPLTDGRPAPVSRAHRGRARLPGPLGALTVVGNRPQFVKAAAVSRLLRAAHEEVLVHTGQHYDDELSRVFFDELDVPAPDHQLGVHDGSNTSQTARMLAALEPLCAETGARRRARLRRHELDAGAGAGWPRPRPGAGRPRRGRDALVRPDDARGAQPRPRRPRLRALLLAPTDTAVENLRREGVAGEVVRWSAT